MNLTCYNKTEFSDLLSLLDSFLFVEKGELRAIYKKFVSKFNSYNLNHWDDFQFFDKKIYKPKSSESNDIYENSNLVGIDLPIMLCDSETSIKKTIMIVGEDPLRKEKDFPERPEDVVIGTPYAFHSGYYREKRTKVYWKVVEDIINQNNRVYLTDIFKVWVKRGKNKKLSFKAVDKIFFINLLQEEVKIINPDLLVIYGVKARDFVESNIEIQSSKKLCLPHPGGGNAKIWSEIIEDKATDDRKIEFLKDKILCKLN